MSANNSELQVGAFENCPVCNGSGKLGETYVYKSQNRYDYDGENIRRSEVCFLCVQTPGHLSSEQKSQWEHMQLCPICKGSGGKRFWSWVEDEQRTNKDFTFTACSLCHGQRRVTNIQLEGHRRQNFNLRFWGISCTTVVVIGGLFVVTQFLTAVVKGMPWFQCCPLPSFLTPVAVLLPIIAKARLS
jgi:RecJ-like exonuclease